MASRKTTTINLDCRTHEIEVIQEPLSHTQLNIKFKVYDRQKMGMVAEIAMEEELLQELANILTSLLCSSRT